MKFRLQTLALALKREDVTIPFNDVSYFWGQMGAGKTSIARLIDYCLGGRIELTPAMQSEFVGSTLNLVLSLGEISIERPRDSDRVIAQWGAGDDAYQLSLPARKADGEVVPDTGVEHLSDLLFWRSDIRPPRVRKSKVKSDSELSRLSIRDLLWYCYLDQDEIDSSFFHLDEGAEFYKRLKSRDVIRYVIGFHDEKVADLEAELDLLRGKHQALSTSIASITKALAEVGVESEAQIGGRIAELTRNATTLRSQTDELRTTLTNQRTTTHAADTLRDQARALGDQLAELEEAERELQQLQERDQRHLNEIETLSLKFRRSASAKAILSGVAFEACPRCAQSLPGHQPGECSLCGQPEGDAPLDPAESALVERDAKARASELTEIMKRHAARRAAIIKEREVLVARKVRIERERNEASVQYDSAYLSTCLANERELASLAQEIDSLTALTRLPRIIEAQREQLGRVLANEQTVRALLKETREAAESDDTNLDKLKKLFLDCLVRSGVPGITPEDRVEIPRTSYYPEVYNKDPNDLSVTTFATLSSGGKKTLFKCCFAIAIHRLARQLTAPLPELLIIDSPMKNISERENRAQFEGFYAMLYELKATELRDTQLILIDKEFSPPAPELRIAITSRHMKPADPDNPPLIPYYQRP